MIAIEFPSILKNIVINGAVPGLLPGDFLKRLLSGSVKNLAPDGGAR